MNFTKGDNSSQMSNQSERVIAARPQTEAYIGQRGHIVLRQEDLYGEEALVVLEPADVPKVIQWLEELVEEQHDWVPSSEEK
jgi:hypothetical protein